MRARPWALLAVAAACSRSVTPDEARPTASARVGPSAEVASSFPISSATPDLEPEDHPFPTRSRLGGVGSTRNTIACGEKRCDAASHDCDWDPLAGDWVCVPQIAPSADGSDVADHPFLVRCDDASDCGPNERCCSSTRNLVSLAHECSPLGDVDGCRQEICHADGAACPAGTACVPTPDADLDPAGVSGVCVPPRGVATCGGKTRCSQSRPVCLLAKRGPPSCAPFDSEPFHAAPIESRLTCTRQGDCSGEEMCFYGFGDTQTLGTLCGRWSRGLSGTPVCDPQGPQKRAATKAELDRVCGSDEPCRTKLVCMPGKELPWMGALTSL